MSTDGLRLVSKQTQAKEWLLAALFFACAFIAVLAVAMIFVFVGYQAWPIITDVGVTNFLFSGDWSPTAGKYGILGLVQGSAIVTIFSLAMGTPLAVCTAIFLSEIASPRIRALVRPAVELLAGIPSVVYGFFGVVVLRPLMGDATTGLGFGPLTASIILAIMIVPTIAALSEDALGSIPMGVREASFAMGATQWQTIYKVVVPAAKIGIVDAIILGMGRAVGETMAVLMLVGGAPQFFAGLGQPMSTLTAQIVMDMSYSTGTHRTALFGMAAILFVTSMALVLSVRLLSRLKHQ
ncbi:MAG: phosphate ABC transporter permease subunit PstC [Coriobacteriia bacterium]|nr:phosphate ABC transporter permease subunit PstC [Coriobacteriia bacterium]